MEGIYGDGRGKSGEGEVDFVGVDMEIRTFGRMVLLIGSSRDDVK